MAQVIYKIINTANGKFYVGSTTNAKERFRTHRSKLNRGSHHCKHLQAAWIKYGAEQFIFKTVEIIPDSESLQEAEDSWLCEHVGKDYCYNSGMRSDAPWRGAPKEQHPSFGRPKSDEERQAISKSLKEFYGKAPENHPMYGHVHTEEAKQKMSRTKKANPSRPWLGIPKSEETRKKIGDAQRGVKKGPRVISPEGLAKMRETILKNAKPMKPADFADVKAKFPQEVQDKYDFSNAVYTGALDRITGCVCPHHGEFSQYAAQFRKGRGCPMCGGEQRALSKKKQMLESWATDEGRAKFMGGRKQVDSEKAKE